MSDSRLRELERAAALGGPEAAARLLRMRLRSGLLEASARRFAAVLTSKGALWLAGGNGRVYDSVEALRAVLLEAGVAEDEARALASSDALWDKVLVLCRERARREWDPIKAIAVLGNRRRIKAALGIDRMPSGTGAEERRLRQLWVDQLDPYYQGTDIADRSWRPPKPQPWPMGWEGLLPVRYAATG
jgi:hypothetical protein